MPILSLASSSARAADSQIIAINNNVEYCSLYQALNLESLDRFVVLLWFPLTQHEMYIRVADEKELLVKLIKHRII